MTVTHLLEERAQSEGERVFVFCEGEEVTYRDMRDRAKRVAANLHAAGVRKGDKIVLLMGNCLEFLYVFLGAGRIGAVVVPVNPMLKPGELAHIVSDSDAETIITIPEFAPLLGQAKGLFPSLKRFYLIGEAIEGAQSFSDLLEHPHEIPPIVAEHRDDAALIYTSGTTGKPKGVRATHAAFLAASRGGTEFDRLDPSDSVLSYLPMAWVGDHLFSFAQWVYVGFTINCPESGDTVMTDLREIGPTYYFAPPRVF
ncbi:MAG: AMP-binding protein, partial [Anaerolineales bacterium]|nr:AMP-binding protein [Anaerolineales bacterium]